MNGNDIVSSLDSMLRWVTRLAFLNLLWLLFTLLGLFFLGVFPSTVAALSVTKKWISGDQGISTWRTFKKHFKENFVSANVMGLLLALIGGILYINYKLISGSSDGVWIGTIVAFYLIIFFFILIVIWSIPLLVQYNNSLFQHLKNALVIGIVKLHYSLAIFLVFFFTIYFSLKFPGIIPFFSISVASLAWYWFALQVFKKMNGT